MTQFNVLAGIITTGICSIIVAIIAAYASLHERAKTTETAINDIHLSLNGRLDELLRITKQLAHSQGVIDGVAQEKARTK